MYGEGKLNLGADLGQVDVNSVGTISHYTATDSAQINLLMTVNFFFDDKSLRTMSRDIEIFLNSLEAVDFGRAEYFKGLMEIMGKEKADKAIADLNLFGNIKKFPDELEKTFFFNDVSFKYYPEVKSFISVGKIGLGNILKNEINRYIPGYIKIDKMRSGGDKMTIYLEVDPTTWYYFEFYKGLMSVISSNNEFNNTIKDMKPKNKKQENVKGPSFQYNICSPQKRVVFLNKLKQIIGETENESEENKDKEKE
jgi:hypothetical protein